MTQPDEARAREIAEKLTTGRKAVLIGVSEGRSTTTKLRPLAPASVRLPWEWAAPHLRWLRDTGLAEYDAGRRIGGQLVHRLTPLGRLVAAEIARMEARET